MVGLMKPLDDGLKQRLVGAIALLALAVIFLPVLFDREPIVPVDRASQIPPPPEIVTVEVAEPVQPEVTDLAPEPQAMFEPDEDDRALPEPEPAGLQASGVPKSWVLQVASFRDQAHAERLRKKLLDAGFSAYTRKASYKNGSIFRVYVGPKLDKSALAAEKARIDRQFELDALMLEFKPQ